LFKSRIEGLRRRMTYRLFDWRTRGVRGLPVLKGDEAQDFVLLTMLCHRDVSQYLLAVNSLGQYLRPRRFYVVDDGSLTRSDIALLKSALQPLTLLQGADFKDPRLPPDPSWQRIQAIAEVVQKSYVVQMDADIFFAGEPVEVMAAVQEKRPFMLGTDEGEQLVKMPEAIAFARQFYDEGERHVQCQCEVNLDVLPEYQERRYVRACAGFSGYTAGSFNGQSLHDISDAFRQRLGEQWPVWGSEQVTSNIILANLSSVEVLPLQGYDSVDHYHSALKMIHFIGSYRFDGGIYQRLASHYLQSRNAQA
jgi:hypothetical protein